jgi:putative flippase GtrA
LTSHVMNEVRASNGAHLDTGSMPVSLLPELTVIVPTRNESGNVDLVIDRLTAAAAGRRIEVLFVDDSDDSTPDEVLERAGSAGPVGVRLIHRERGERHGGLGGAVVEGLRQARGPWAVVMDGDMQHPPELALRLAEIGRSRSLDLVMASRYVGGGDAGGLASRLRTAMSAVATGVAKAIFPLRLGQSTDPMSGLFAVRPSALDLDRLEPPGFKVLMEILVRNPGLRTAEVPFAMRPRLTGESKASIGEATRFVRHLAQLRFAPRGGRSAGSAGGDRGSWLVRGMMFGLVGLTGLGVNTGVLWLLGVQVPALPYLIAAVVATEASTAWLFLLTERLVFRGEKPGTPGSRAARFFLLNNVALVLRLPLLALLVEWVGLGVLVANLGTLVLLFVVRFLVADGAIYGSGTTPRRSRDPMRVVVEDATVADDHGSATTEAGAVRNSRSAPSGQRFLPYRYEIPGVATIGSQVRLRELEYFRAQQLGLDTEIQVRVGHVGPMTPRLRATMTQLAAPAGVDYAEHFGRWGANFRVELGPPIVVTVAPALAHSPHVVYTNVLEALLRFVAVSKGAMLLHSACLQLDGVGVLISAETDTGKTGTVLRMVRELGAKFLSDDMTVLHADGRVGCFPKPLTISAHTLRAISSDELSRSEWRRLQVQSRLHSKEGRQFAMLLSRLNIPIMGVNALTQRLVPPPKYTVDRLLPCTIIPETAVTELFVISRGEFGAGRLSRADAMTTLLANTEDAYQFPPFKQLAPSIVIGGDDHDELRRKERAILASALGRLRCRWLSTPDFSWADEIPRTLRADAQARLSS